MIDCRAGDFPMIHIDEGVNIRPSTVEQIYEAQVDSVLSVFGLELQPSSVNSITFRNRRIKVRDNLLLNGSFNPTTRGITIYPPAIATQTRRWEEVLGHELGHAIQLQAEIGFQFTTEATEEAFAETIGIVANSRGDLGAVIPLLSKFSASDRLLFGPLNQLTVAPNLDDRQKDAAQLMYIITHFGIENGLRILRLPFNRASNDPYDLSSRINTFFGATIGITRHELYYLSRRWFARQSTSELQIAG